MEYELRIIVEKVAYSNGEVVKRETLIPYEIKHPESILDLGLRHKEQISLLEKVQNVILAEQTILIDLEPKDCPKCGGKIKKNGYKESDFHTVFSDHQLKMHSSSML